MMGVEEEDSGGWWLEVGDWRLEVVCREEDGRGRAGFRAGFQDASVVMRSSRSSSAVLGAGTSDF